jgi:hypothetical protein
VVGLQGRITGIGRVGFLAVRGVVELEFADHSVQVGDVGLQGDALQRRQVAAACGGEVQRRGGLVAGRGEPGEVHACAARVRAVQAHVVQRQGAAERFGLLAADRGGAR